MPITSKNNSNEIYSEKSEFKTKVSHIEIPNVDIPSGGGNIKGINHEYTHDSFKGNISYEIPLPFSRSRGVKPAISLKYSSQNGNSVVGLGWDLILSSITRKTNNAIPKYFDNIDSDKFILEGYDDLTPAYKINSTGKYEVDNENNYIIDDKPSLNGKFIIRRYKPRIESLFARIERFTNKNNGNVHWVTRSGENIVTVYGHSTNAKIVNPGDQNEVFKWLPEYSYDDKGNVVRYIYKSENKDNLDMDKLSNAERVENDNIIYTNKYISKVYYTNKTPFIELDNIVDNEVISDKIPNINDFLMETVFDYGEYDSLFNETKLWDERIDSFSRFNSSFEIRTTRLLKRIFTIHHFDELPQGFSVTNAIELKYNNSNGISLLTASQSIGYRKKIDGTYTSQKIPEHTYTYSENKLNQDSQIKVKSDGNLPIGMMNGYTFVDLYSEGISGILYENEGAFYYLTNNGNLQFDEEKVLDNIPNSFGLNSKIFLTDLNSNFTKTFVEFDKDVIRNYGINLQDNETISLPSHVNQDIKDKKIRMLDINGDSKPDLVIIENNEVKIIENFGTNGYSDVSNILNSNYTPKIIFESEIEKIFLADMNGDGLIDIVKIENDSIIYFANSGYGTFSKGYTLTLKEFDYSDQFNPNNIKLSDIDGDGCTDILYFKGNKIDIYNNKNGNNLTLSTIENTPEFSDHIQVDVVDVYGRGTSTIVYSSVLDKDSSVSFKYIDLYNVKPYLLTSHENNFGGKINFYYKSSVEYYLKYKYSDTPWITKLPFVSHLVSNIEQIDLITNQKYSTKFEYFHGYFDPSEREFRGFGRIDSLDSEEFMNYILGGGSNIVEEKYFQPPIMSRVWNHLGFDLRLNNYYDKIKKEFWQTKYKKLTGFDPTFTERNINNGNIEVGERLENSIIPKLSPSVWDEGYRACAGLSIRKEIFIMDSKDADINSIVEESIPLRVSEIGFTMELLQNTFTDNNAVYIIKESENIEYIYDRSINDPRIIQKYNLKLDNYGNPLEAVVIAYPRHNPDMTLPSNVILQQSKLNIQYYNNTFTNDWDDNQTYRLRQPVRTSVYELKGLNYVGTFLDKSKFNNIFTNSVKLFYHEENVIPVPNKTYLRLINSNVNLYYNNDFTDKLALGTMARLGVIYETYTLAYDEKLVDFIYSDKVSPIDLQNNHFVHLNDSNWWIPSGITKYKSNAENIIDIKNRFYMPIGYVSTIGAETKIKYYFKYNLLIEETIDALSNSNKVLEFDFYTLAPSKIIDVNDNITETLSDELGAIRAVAICGKLDTGNNLNGQSIHTDGSTKANIDNLINSTESNIHSNAINCINNASIYYTRDLFAFVNFKKPVSNYLIFREKHVKDGETKVQIKVDYHNGIGEIIGSKVQAEAGMAKKFVINESNEISSVEVDTGNIPRWVGNGRIVKNNKGSVIKNFEPYFSTTHQFEKESLIVEIGVSQVNYYDALNRVIRSEFPNNTFSTVKFDAYKVIKFDQNDNLLESNWYKNRKNNLINTELTQKGYDPNIENTSAINTESHNNTPQVIHLDSLGRPIMQIDNLGIVGGSEKLLKTILNLDFDGAISSIIDPRGNKLVSYYRNMVGNICKESSIDKGTRWIFNDTEDKNIFNFDSKNHKIIFDYDELSRNIAKTIKGGTENYNSIFHKVIYGESILNAKNNNLRKQIAIIYDTAGKIEIEKYNESYQVLIQKRKILLDYKNLPNYNIANPDSLLEADNFVVTTKYDAINRIYEQTSIDNSVLKLNYNQGRMMEKVIINQDLIDKTFVENIEYNEKGQRLKIKYGNNVNTTYNYDKDNFRLVNVQTKRSNNTILQDLIYSYDSVGNITAIIDKSVPTTFFGNFASSSLSTYIYDPMYRLISATGREHIAQTNYNEQDNFADIGFSLDLAPSDPMAFRKYTENYKYDEMGNILELSHIATGNTWKRKYSYNPNSNKLSNTEINGLGIITQNYNYSFDADHGFLTSIPHLSHIEFDFIERMKSTSNQFVNSGVGETTYYLYDSNGKRVKKITENFSQDGITFTKKNERLYVGAVEIFKKYDNNSLNLIRNTYKVNDAYGLVAVIDKRVFGNDEFESNLVRYQLTNHIDSSSIEFDDSINANVISYEEFHPFGTTSYLAQNKSIKATAKRYKFTGKERDNETGFQFHGKRYYIPWLGRWASTDPIGISDGLNTYCYVSNNPVRFNDPTGTSGWDRFCGGLKMVGGAFETVAGAGLFLAGVGTSELGVGVPVAIAGGAVTLHGVDTTVSGFRTMWNGEQVDTVTSSVVLQDGLGMSRTSANLTDGAISIVGTLGANVATRAPGLVSTVAADGTAAAPAVETSVSIAFKPAGAVGHNMVGVTTETGTTWTHLVIAEQGATTGASGVNVMTSGRAAVVIAESGPSSAYTVVTIPVTAAEATSASTYAMSTVARYEPIIVAIENGTASTSALPSYTLLGNSCSTYAAEVLQAGGVVTPPVTAPIINLGVGALQSSRVMQPLTSTALGLAVTDEALTAAPLMISEAQAAPPPSPLFSVAPSRSTAPIRIIIIQTPASPPPACISPVVETQVCEAPPPVDFSSQVCEMPDYSAMTCQ